MAHADARGHRKALGILIGADRRIYQLVRNRVCQLLPLLIRDELEHEVDGRGPARRGQPVAVHHEDGFREVHFLKLFGKTILIFPMDGGLLAVQQTGPRQCVGRRAQPAHGHALAGFAAHPAQQTLRRRGLHVDATAEHDGIVARQLIKIAIEREARPGGACHLFAAFTDDTPVIGLPAHHPVGDAQAFHGRGKAQKREVLQQDEDEPAGTVEILRYPGGLSRF